MTFREEFHDDVDTLCRLIDARDGGVICIGSGGPVEIRPALTRGRRCERTHAVLTLRKRLENTGWTVVEIGPAKIVARRGRNPAREFPIYELVDCQGERP